MPTSSQNQVLSKVTGKGHKRKTKKIRKINLDAEPSYVSEHRLLSGKGESVEEKLETPDEGEGKNEEEVQRLLHDLGFWDKTTNKEKIGIKGEEETCISQNEYSQIIAEEVMAKVKNEVAKRDPPEPMPATLSFDLKGSAADHSDVLFEIRQLISLIRGDDCQIKTIQFLPQQRRWLINMDSPESRDRLAGSNLVINGYHTQLRRYDDITKLEYRKYLRANGLIEMVNNAF